MYLITLASNSERKELMMQKLKKNVALGSS